MKKSPKIVLMNDNKCILFEYNLNKEIPMNNMFSFFQEIFMLKKDDNIKVGLTQFKETKIEPLHKDVSITKKDVKLSDLMRRVS